MGQSLSIVQATNLHALTSTRFPTYSSRRWRRRITITWRTEILTLLQIISIH